MINIVQGKKISNGAKALQLELMNRSGVPFGRRNIYGEFNWSRYIHGQVTPANTYKNTLFVNWGDAHSMPGLAGYTGRMEIINNHILNRNIGSYTDKLRFFKWLAHANQNDLVPAWWNSKLSAQAWLNEQPSSALLCVRHKTSSSGSNGLEIVSKEDIDNSPNGLPNVTLYTQYIPKKQEFRCHIFRWGDDVWQQKKLRSGTENPNFKIRNHLGGWVFARENITVPSAAKSVIQQFKTTFFDTWKCDFAAVDVIWNEQQNRAYILEINSAPGLEGQTVKDYADFVYKAYENKILGSMV